MTNRIALALGILIAALMALDYTLFDAGWLIFLSQKLVDLTEYLAFWR